MARIPVISNGGSRSPLARSGSERLNVYHEEALNPPTLSYRYRKERVLKSFKKQLILIGADPDAYRRVKQLICQTMAMLNAYSTTSRPI
jgi:hypothetical protein